MTSATSVQPRDWILTKFGTSSDTTVDKIIAIKNLFNLSNDEVYIQWESFAVTHLDEDEVDINPANIEQFEAHLHKLLASNLAKKTPAVKKVVDLSSSRKPIDFSSSPSTRLPSTPVLKRRKLQQHQLTQLAPLSDAPSLPTGLPLSPQKPTQDSNTIVETLNPDVEIDAYAGVQLTANFDAAKYKFRTMAMKLLESADVLDDQIDTLSLQMVAQHKDTDLLQLGNPCVPSQFEIVCCGRIVPDSPLYDTMAHVTLNDKSLFLETSRLGGIGQRIPLDLSGLEEFSLFPGQIVALRGRNPTGRAFIVREVMPTPDIGTPVSSAAELAEYRHGGHRTVVVAGPYSNQNKLDYLKLEALVERINLEIKPQVVIMLGPFLDVSNTAVAAGDVEIPSLAANKQPRNLDELFKLAVVPVLKQINPEIQVVLIPSVRDAFSNHTSYPQVGFDRKKLGLPKNFKTFPNPSNFNVNEVLFGASNADIFKDLRDVYKSKLSAEKSRLFSNRFERIANHVFEQKRYYPYFPGFLRRIPLPREELDKDTALFDGVMGEELAETEVGGLSLELPYLGLTEIGDTLPDVMIVPSELKYFAKVIKSVVVINPGQFIRPGKDALREDGSYVVMSVKAPAMDEEDNNVEQVPGSDLFYHNVYKRAKIDIYKS